MSPRVFLLRPIGKVVKPSGSLPQLVVDPAYVQGLRHLEGFSHLIVVWWADGCDTIGEREVLEVRPPLDRFPDAPRMGVEVVDVDA